MKNIFIDGAVGTTGLRIASRLKSRTDINLIRLSGEDRKNPGKRKETLNSCDIALLCLPDQAAKEAVSMVENPNVVILDTSTAHRTHPDWTYGFPELYEGQADKIKDSKRISIPGCHVSGFIVLTNPLTEMGLLKKNAKLTCVSLTGYSGGGKAMIADYEQAELPYDLKAPRLYGLSQSHKHLPEMKKYSGLDGEPVFTPIVSNYYSGMLVMVPIHAEDLTENSTSQDILNIYQSRYQGPIVKASSKLDENESGFIGAHTWQGKDSMTLSVVGNEDRMLLLAGYDNLGKGASGAAVQCLNLVLGNDETKGLEL